MRKSIKYSLLAVLAVLGLASCSNDYEYSGAEAMKNAQVFFADKTLAITSYNLDMDANSFDVEIQRVKTEGELTVKLENHQNPNSTTQLDVPASVTFADGADKALITIGYNPETIEFDDLNRDTLVIADADYTTPYGGTEYRFTVGIAAPWEDMGMATYREDLVTHWFNVQNVVYQVPIQKDLTRPGVYRLVNPYGEYYPYNEDADYDHDTDTYMVIHAEDPDHVWIEMLYSTMDWNPEEYGKFRFGSLAGFWIAGGNTVEEVIEARPDVFGTLKDGIITMPTDAMLISMELYNNGGFYNANNNGLFAIALPGYELVSYDYSVEALFAGILKTPAEENQAVVDFTLAEDVAKAKYAMTDASVTESAAAAAIVSGELESEEITESGRVYLPLEEDGKYRVTIVSFDGEGNAQESASCVFEFTKGESPWESLGMGLYTEDFLTTFYKVDNQTYEVEILASKTTPGIYRLKNAYGEAYPYNEPGDWDDSMDYFIEINAENPDFVYIPQQETGLNWGNGMMSIVSQGARYVAAYPDYPVTAFADYAPFGTLSEGVITFPQYVGESEDEVPALFVSLSDVQSGALYPANKNGAFKVVLPGAASPSAIKAAQFARRLRGGKAFGTSAKPAKVVALKIMKSNVKNQKATTVLK